MDMWMKTLRIPTVTSVNKEFCSHQAINYCSCPNGALGGPWS